MGYKRYCLSIETSELIREIEELRLDRSRWAAHALAGDLAMAKVRFARRRAAAMLPPMPVIVGAPRSGTTLLRFMLDAHPSMAIPPETGFLMQAKFIPEGVEGARGALFDLITNFPAAGPTWDDFGLTHEQLRDALETVEPFDVADGLRAFYRLYAAQHGKLRYGDKTPLYCAHLDAIRETLPEARFLHIIRDGRDAALSLRPLWFAPGQDIATLAGEWKRLVMAARAAAGKDYLEVRYERLLTETEPVLREVCEFIDLKFDPAMLRYFERTPERLKEHVTRRDAEGVVVVSHEQRLQQHTLTMQPPKRERMNRWKEEMSAGEQAEFHSVAGDLLEELGYEL